MSVPPVDEAEHSSPDRPAERTPPDGLQNPARLLAMCAIMLGLGLATMDAVIANVALPAIGADLGVDASAIVWIVNAYQLALACALLPCASLGEIVGYRQVYRCGLIVFALASLACAFSHSLTILILARTLQGFGAGGILSVNSALVRNIWPRASLGRGIGINATIAAGGFALGPTAAATILSLAPWPWLFAINVPLGAIAIAVAMASLPGTKPRAGRFDYISALLTALVCLTAAGAFYAATRSGSAAPAVACLIGCLVTSVILFRRETKSDAPLFPVDLLHIPLFRGSVLSSICSFSALSLAMVGLPFYLQAALHWPASRIGFLVTPWPLATALTGLVGGRLADRYPPGPLGGLGMAVFGAALLSVMAAVAMGPLAVGGCLSLCGIGFGLFQTPNNRALLGSVPLHRTGGASGMLGLSRTVGLTLGSVIASLAFRAGQEGALIALVLAVLSAALAALVSLSRGQENTG